MLPECLNDIFFIASSSQACRAALVGCVPNAVNHIIGDPSQEKIPPNQLADYLATDCTDIWSLSGQSTETNPLYWLRAMDCADRMMPVQARSEASAQLTDTAERFQTRDPA